MPHRLLAFFDRRLLAILGVVLLAITMRSGVAAVSTLIELIRQDFDLSTTFLPGWVKYATKDARFEVNHEDGMPAIMSHARDQGRWARDPLAGAGWSPDCDR